MFRFLRGLAGRDKHADEATLAYIEGRADAVAAARVRERLAAAPAQREDVESLRATVSLLRSVASARAPRSFALREAPVPARASYRPACYTRAPAMAAAATVAVVGVLLIGDLAGALRQSGGAGREATQSLAAPDMQVAPEAAAMKADGPAAGGGPAETLKMALPPPAPASAAAAAPAATAATAGVAARAVAPSAAVTPEGTVASQAGRPGAAVTGAPEPAASKAAAGGPAAQADLANGTPASAPVAVEPGPGLASEPVAIEQEAGGGVALPLWQLEAGLVGAVVLLLAVWLALRRRRTPS
jgi:hypothetical protein